MKPIVLSLPVIGVLAVAVGAKSMRHQTPLIVHEWGTITTHHLPDGTPEGRLNRITEAEVLPSFVHRYEPPSTRDMPSQSLLKSPLLPGRPDITMRLETPVLYFHVPPGTSVHPFDVAVRFRGGALNEFYPNGEPSVDLDVERINAKMQSGMQWNGQVLDDYVVSRLVWSGVTLRDTVPLTRTTTKVWLAPRQVRSSGVVTPSAESERYLFYRGVAHLDALVQTELLAGEVRLRAPRRLQWMRTSTMRIPQLWLVEVRPNGTVAYRKHEQILINKSTPSENLARLATFSDRDYGRDRLDSLRASIKQSLLAAGLYDDEAHAMLETWKSSYFETPGLRLFYIVPAEWLDYFLPLEISAPHELKRVLVGRIDLERPGRD
jgi:hypothetical protein